MVKERLKEVVDFVTIESPYQSANRGWLNKHVYLKWGSSNIEDSTYKDELLNIAVFWTPLKQFFIRILLVLFLAFALVILSISFAQGKLNININSLSLNNEVDIGNQFIQSPPSIETIDMEDQEDAELIIQEP